VRAPDEAAVFGDALTAEPCRLERFEHCGEGGIVGRCARNASGAPESIVIHGQPVHRLPRDQSCRQSWGRRLPPGRFGLIRRGYRVGTPARHLPPRRDLAMTPSNTAGPTTPPEGQVPVPMPSPIPEPEPTTPIPNPEPGPFGPPPEPGPPIAMR
jgi:hypothetical protein